MEGDVFGVDVLGIDVLKLDVMALPLLFTVPLQEHFHIKMSGICDVKS